MLKIRPRRKATRGELLRQCLRAQEVGAIHLRLSRILAVELKRVVPDHVVFTDGTFAPESVTAISNDVVAYKDYTALRAAK